MKKRILALLLCMSCLFLFACKKEETEVDFYAQDIIKSSGKQLESEYRLPGLSEGRAEVPDDSKYDPELVTALSAGLFDDTENEVLYAKASTEKLYPASVTKCMTALLVLENVEDLSELVTVTEAMNYAQTDHSSSAGLLLGDKLSVRDLLCGLLIPSGNDAANVLAEYVSGDVESFVILMNEKAKELGMLNTHFMNPHGLHHDKHYTTAYDLYLLMHECLKYDLFTEIAGSKEETVRIIHEDGEEEIRSYVSGNSIIKGYTKLPDEFYIIGGKTGYTEIAGRCLLFAVTGKDHHTYISVICHAKDYENVYLDTVRVLSTVEFQ